MVEKETMKNIRDYLKNVLYDSCLNVKYDYPNLENIEFTFTVNMKSFDEDNLNMWEDMYKFKIP